MDMDYSGVDNVPATDMSSNFGEPGRNITSLDPDKSRSVMQTENVKELADEHRGPDSTPATSEPQSAMPDQKHAPYGLQRDEATTSVERQVHRNGEVAGGVCAESSLQNSTLNRCQEMVLSSSWHGEDMQPQAIGTNDVKDQSMAAKPVLSPNGAISDMVFKSPVGTDHEEGGSHSDVHERSPQRSETQKVGVVGEKKEGGEEGGDNDDRRRRLMHRLMGSIMASTLLVITAYLSMVPLMSQFLLRRIAVEHFNLTNITLKKTPCADGKNSSMHDALNWLQGQTSQQLLYLNLVQSIPALFVALFVGSYADYFGRKLLVLVPMIGGFLKSLVTVLVIYLELDIRYLYVGQALDGVLGSVHVLTLGLFAAIADVTISSQQRVLMFAVLEISVALSGAVSQIGTGYLIDAIGFVGPSFIVACLFLVACFVIILFMPETLHTKPEHLVLNPLVHLRKVFGFYFWDGPLSKRALFICGTSIMFFISMVTFGRLPVETLFQMDSPLCWDSIKIGFFMGIRSLIQNLAGVAVLKVLSKYVRIELIGVLGLMSGIAGFTVEALADNDLMMYISGVVGMLVTVMGPVARTLLSRMVPAESQGALFASLAAVETLCMLTASLVFNNVYTATLNVFPGAVFLLIAALLLVDFLLLILFTLVSRKFPHFQLIQIEVKKSDDDASPPSTPSYHRPIDETTPLLTESNGTETHLWARLQQERNKITASTRRTRSFVY